MNDPVIHADSDPTVQTPSGPPGTAIGHWRVSLSEIDAMGRKAARGAGHAWGMAEEAGSAARWLAAWGLPGPETLLAALEATDRRVASHVPDPDAPVWTAPAGPLCPVTAGALLSDRAEDIRDGRTIRLGPVLCPLLLLPPLCRASRDLSISVALSGDGLSAIAAADGPASGDWQAWQRRLADSLTVTRATRSGSPVLTHGPDSYPVPVAAWRGLDRLAHRTYAPATEESRRSGAGAGLRDSD